MVRQLKLLARARALDDSSVERFMEMLHRIGHRAHFALPMEFKARVQFLQSVASRLFRRLGRFERGLDMAQNVTVVLVAPAALLEHLVGRRSWRRSE